MIAKLWPNLRYGKNDRLRYGNDTLLPQGVSPVHAYDNVYSEDTFYWGTEPNSLCQTIADLCRASDATNTNVIDLGCGEGKDVIHFAKQGMSPTGVDISRPGLDKANRWATREALSIHTVEANLTTFRLAEMYDVVYSSGSLTYIAPEARSEVFENYKQFTNRGGLNAFNAFVEKPFITPAPDWGDDEYFYRSGDLLLVYWDWEIVSCSEIIFDCNSGGARHRHAMDTLIARKP